MLDKAKLAALLGRSLTSSESSNYETYLDIAAKRLSHLVCFSLDTKTGERTFGSRDGYRTLFLDPFTAVTAVEIDGSAITTFVKKQNDSYQGSWFNSLEFDDKLAGDKITVTATWGFGDNLPNDLAALLADMFALHEAEANNPSNVKAKSIEDYRVEYNDGSPFEALVSKHIHTLAKYAQCEKEVLHGLEPVYYY